jgi:hypothetical protein
MRIKPRNARKAAVCRGEAFACRLAEYPPCSRGKCFARTTFRALFACLLLVGILLAFPIPAPAQRLRLVMPKVRRQVPRRANPNQAAPAQVAGDNERAENPRANAADAQRAREMIALFLREGQRQPYVGEQTTRLLAGRVRESRQIVKHAEPGRERIEYLSPPAMRGEIILINSGRMYHYKPSLNRILEGPALLEEFQNRVREAMLAMRQGRILARVVGTQLVAGQSAAIIEIRSLRPNAAYKRFWIDEKTGVRLRMEDVGARGEVVSTSYFTTVDYAPVFDPKEFRPDSLPAVPHEPMLPAKPPLASVQAAQQQVAYPIREPAVPEGYRLNGVWVVNQPGQRRTVILRYTDGVNTFALFQHPLGPRAADSPGFPRTRSGVTQWIAGGRLYLLIGNLKPESVRQIVSSLR